jgi:hypothetical protein
VGWVQLGQLVSNGVVLAVEQQQDALADVRVWGEVGSVRPRVQGVRRYAHGLRDPGQEGLFRMGQGDTSLGFLT